MAKAKGRTEPTRGEIIVSPKNVSLTPAPIVETERQTVNIPTPAEFTEGDEVSTLCPMVVFKEDTKPGQYVSGTYMGFKENVGPNSSRIYLLEGGGQVVGVWGSAALDNQFDFGNPKPKVGDKILIQYLGAVETKRGLNPAKIFRVKVAR